MLPVEQLVKLSPIERIQHAAKGEQLQLIGLLYKGCALVGINEQMEHGQYRKELANVGLKKSDANRAENVWRLSLLIKPSNVPALVHLSPSKVYLLLCWEPDEVDAFLEGKRIRGITIDDAQEYSVREMEQQLKTNAEGMQAAQKKIDRLSQDNLVITEEALALKHQLANKHAGRFPDYVMMVRDESTALSSEIEFRIDSMEQLYQHLQDQAAITKTDKQSKRDLQIAQISLYHNLNGAIARGIVLLAELQERFGEVATGTLTDSEAMYTAEEAAYAVKDREALLQLAKADAQLRSDRRERDKPRGRKRTTKTKGR
jgi:hypothetical protein